MTRWTQDPSGLPEKIERLFGGALEDEDERNYLREIFKAASDVLDHFETLESHLAWGNEREREAWKAIASLASTWSDLVEDRAYPVSSCGRCGQECSVCECKNGSRNDGANPNGSAACCADCGSDDLSWDDDPNEAHAVCNDCGECESRPVWIEARS